MKFLLPACLSLVLSSLMQAPALAVTEKKFICKATTTSMFVYDWASKEVIKKQTTECNDSQNVRFQSLCSNVDVKIIDNYLYWGRWRPLELLPDGPNISHTETTVNYGELDTFTVFSNRIGLIIKHEATKVRFDSEVVLQERRAVSYKCSKY